MVKAKKALGCLLLLAMVVLSTSCSSLFEKDVVQSSKSRDRKVAKAGNYVPLTGRMDGVEFHINEELKSHGLDATPFEFDELEEIFGKSLRAWKPDRKNSIPIVQNARVEKWIRNFTGPLRKHYTRWLRRASLYAPTIERVLDEYKVPRDLIYLSMIESGFNLNAYSHAHAAGPWQFIRSTGSMYGLDSSGLVDERRDLIKASRAAASHLRDLYRKYGDWYLAFAAYNAGPGTVNRAITRGHSKNFWKLSSQRSRLFRQETKDYVPKILAAAIIAKNYHKYGFSSKLFIDPLDFDIVQVPDATDLGVVAHCSNTKLSHIKFLNPSLISGVTPPGKPYRVNIPRGMAKVFKKKYAKIPRSKRARFVFHTVGARETIASVASRYHVSRVSLASANQLSTRSSLARGRTLVIPKSRTMFNEIQKVPTLTAETFIAQNGNQKSRAIFEDSQPEPEVVIADASKETRKPAQSLEDVIDTEVNDEDHLKPVIIPDTVTAAATITQKYKVRSGDTLSVIAKKQGVSVASLKAWNQLGSKSVIRAGQVLKVSAPTAVVLASNDDQEDVQEHRVRSGETLSAIARKYRVSLKDIRQWNKMGKSNAIRAGQVLQLSAPSHHRTPSAQEYANVLPEDKSDTYKIARGDTLSGIAAKHHMSVAALQSLNGLGSKSRITAGQILKVSPSSRDKVQLPSAPLVAQKSEPAVISRYKVERGDTLGRIAGLHHTNVATLMTLNDLESPRMIKAGQQIKVPGKAVASSGTRLQQDERLIIHAVRKGETLWDISRKYRVSIQELRQWNDLKGNDIRPNMKIKIYADARMGRPKQAA